MKKAFAIENLTRNYVLWGILLPTQQAKKHLPFYHCDRFTVSVQWTLGQSQWQTLTVLVAESHCLPRHLCVTPHNGHKT